MRATQWTRYAAFFVLAATGCGLDLLTKSWIFNKLGMPVGPVWWVWKDVIGFQTSLNPGALFGLGAGLGPLLVAVAIIALGAIGYWVFFRDGASDWLSTIALALITAGICGNLYDRLGLPGLVGEHDPAGQPIAQVRDWILVMIGPYRWPNFNIADSLLVCGAGLLIIHAFWAASRQEVAHPKTTPAVPQQPEQQA
jgi:signal peptidase II